ncbi:hypothetical protein VC279_22535 [Xanthomonas sp. WHRI 10064A]|uniref:hypothetical protein n=1 Tax=unclassified Xanthomonas TaxID=2643310 RepID=UPI002B223B43|nr:MULTISPECIES: hypothetical protein [unclassified Xanthomonas]MEA9589743.1 hypothetical protein [Xanthomonas sp. WHRI 10064B]MEA9617371.1 hypothetical protein [Xanthomonas sp. WHRI 10064A]
MITDEIKVRTAFVLNVLSMSEMPVCFFRFDGARQSGDKIFLHEISVSIIYFCLVTNLIKIVPDDWFETNGIGTLEEYAKMLLDINPDDDGERMGIDENDYSARLMVWMDAQIECTALGNELVYFYFPNGVDINDINVSRDFWDQLIKNFQEERFKYFSKNLSYLWQ